MKHAAKFTLIAGSALLLAMLAVANWGVNVNVKVLKANQAPILIWADGGVPIPPPPKGSGFSAATANALLLADGGVPIPPPPTGTRFSPTAATLTLVADGGVPIPPPPTSSQIV